MADSHGFLKRSERGRFARGTNPGPGRPRGAPNRATIDARELKRRIIASWDGVQGDRRLVELAKTDFPAYLRTVSSLLPKQDLPLTPIECREKLHLVLEEFRAHCTCWGAFSMLALLVAFGRKEREALLRRFLDATETYTEPEAAAVANAVNETLELLTDTILSSSQPTTGDAGAAVAPRLGGQLPEVPPPPIAECSETQRPPNGRL